MKKLTSLFRKSPFAKSFSLKLMFLGSAVIVGCVVLFVNCRTNRATISEVPENEWHANPFSALTDKLEEEVKGEFVNLSTQAGTIVGEMGVGFCERVSKWPQSVELHLPIQTYFGPHKISLAVQTHSILVRVEGKTFTIKNQEGLPADFMTRVCRALDGDSDQPYVLSSSVISLLASWLAEAVPDCQFAEVPGPSGWDCRLAVADPSSSLRELAGIQATMIRRWSRQPYLLSRRLAVATSLAEALRRDDGAKRLDTFCRIIRHSLPIELPVIVASRKWQTAVCAEDSPARKEAAHFGLVKATAEIDFLRQMFERTSKLGYLAVRIPRDEAPRGVLWVSLAPEKEVRDQLENEAAILLSENGATDIPMFCWHPVFAESLEGMQMARYLNLVNGSQNLVCQEEERGTFSPARYLADSIMSETEFVVSNGRAKMLRLPAGTYRYSLHELPEDPNEWDDAAHGGPQSSGKIAWVNRRPRPTIKTW